MPKETIIAQTQWASGLQPNIAQKSLKQLTQFLATSA